MYFICCPKMTLASDSRAYDENASVRNSVAGCGEHEHAEVEMDRRSMRCSWTHKHTQQHKRDVEHEAVHERLARLHRVHLRSPEEKEVTRICDHYRPPESRPQPTLMRKNRVPNLKFPLAAARRR